MASQARKLDQTKPYAIVCGLPGAHYQQDGVLFTVSGEESQGTTPLKEPDIEPPEDPNDIPRCIMAESPPAPAETLEPGKMHWKHARAMVETYGGTWTNMKDAMEFLKGKGK
jgi:hypothetical protein